MEEKVVATALYAVTLGGDCAIAYKHVAQSALEVATSPLAWKRASSGLYACRHAYAYTAVMGEREIESRCQLPNIMHKLIKFRLESKSQILLARRLCCYDLAAP